MADGITIEVNAVDNASAILTGVAGGISAAFGTALIDAAGAGFNFVKEQLTEFVSIAATAEQGQVKLNAILKATDEAAGFSAEQINAMAQSMSDLTGVDDDAIISAQSLLLTFRNVAGQAFPDAMTASLNLQTTFGSLEASTMQVGKALNDPIAGISALGRAGVTFSEEQKAMIESLVESGDLLGAQNIILEEIEKQVGGTAEALGNTFTGKLNKFNNSIENIKESLGSKLLPILSPLIDKFALLAEQYAPLLADVFDKLIVPALIKTVDFIVLAMGNISALSDLVNNSSSLIGEKLVAPFNILSQWWKDHGEGITASGKQMFDSLVYGIDALWKQMEPFVEEILNKFIVWFITNGPLIEAYIQSQADKFSTLVAAVVSAWTIIEPILRGLFQIILDLATFAMAISAGDWATAWAAIKQVVIDAWVGIRDSIIALLNEVSTSMGGSKFEEIKTVWSDNWNQAVEILNKIAIIIVDKVVEFITGVYNSINDKIAEIKTKWSDGWSALNTMLATAAVSIIARVAKFILDVYNAINNKFTEIKTKWGEGWTALITILSGFITTIGTKAGEMATAAYNFGSAFVTAIVSGVNSVMQTLIDAVNGIINLFEFDPITIPVTPAPTELAYSTAGGNNAIASGKTSSVERKIDTFDYERFAIVIRDAFLQVTK